MLLVVPSGEYFFSLPNSKVILTGYDYLQPTSNHNLVEVFSNQRQIKIQNNTSTAIPLKLFFSPKQPTLESLKNMTTERLNIYKQIAQIVIEKQKKQLLLNENTFATKVYGELYQKNTDLELEEFTYINDFLVSLYSLKETINMTEIPINEILS